MTIPWGKSVLNQACDAEVAEDFNPKLHEHFKMARRANMKPGPESGSRGELAHPETGALNYIEHNRKTGEVASRPMEATGFYGSGKYGGVAHSDPKEARKHLNAAKVQSRSFQEKESGRANYRESLREEKKNK